MAVADQRRGQLAVDVPPRAGHPGKGAGDVDPGLVPAMRHYGQFLLPAVRAVLL